MAAKRTKRTTSRAAPPRKAKAEEPSRRGSVKKAAGSSRKNVTGDGGSTGAPTSAAVLIPDSGQVIVRMYRQGLGDCFLLAFRAARAGEVRYVLVDCGVHAREDKGPARLLRVMEHLKAATAGRLDVVVATHEHADHLSGFVQKKSPFLQPDFKIGALWVAWTEKVGDTQADELRRKRGAARALIAKALEECKKRSALGATAKKLQDEISGLNDFEEPADDSFEPQPVYGALTTLGAAPTRKKASAAQKKAPGPKKPSSNELALELLKTKAGESNVSYCEPGQVLKISGLPTVRVHVLGPPRTLELLKKDLPTKIRGGEKGHGAYKEVYLSGGAGSMALGLSPALGLDVEAGSALLPEDWRHPFQTAYRRQYTIKRNGDFQWTGESTAGEDTRELIEKEYLATESSWRRIDADWLGAASQLALNLDSDTNNTSLALAFEIGLPGDERVLLFPGDAQVGNWLSWRDQKFKSGSGTTDADELLKRTLLYKVGHHGSHNATLRRDPRETTAGDSLGVAYGLELMNDIVAMIPVDWAAAQKKMPDVWRMPHEPLYRRLREKARLRILRSDAETKPLDGKTEDADLIPMKTDWTPVPGLKDIRWRRSVEQFAEDEGTQVPLYYDVAIPLEPGGD